MARAKYGARMGRRCAQHAARSGALHAHPRVDPAGRPAAGALRVRRCSPSRRRRHRPPPSGHASDGLRRPRCCRQRRPRVQAASPERPAWRRHLSGRGVGHRHRECAHGGRPGARRDPISNAACEPHVQDLCRMLQEMGAAVEGVGSNVLTVHGSTSCAGALPDRSRPHRGRLVHRPGRGHGRRSRHRGRRPRAPARDLPHLLPSGSRSSATRNETVFVWLPDSDSRSSTIYTIRSPRSRTAPGRCSRPT